MPPEHVLSLAHVTPQAPQFVGLVASLTHAPAQRLGAFEEHWQTPLVHCWPAGHTVPHAPQLLLSLWVLVQEPPQ